MLRSAIAASAAASLGFALILGAGAAQAQGWRCSARGLVDYSFDGSGCATIHLQGYPSGNCYDVRLKGNTASGTTSDGTPFVCRKG